MLCGVDPLFHFLLCFFWLRWVPRLKCFQLSHLSSSQFTFSFFFLFSVVVLFIATPAPYNGAAPRITCSYHQLRFQFFRGRVAHSQSKRFKYRFGRAWSVTYFPSSPSPSFPRPSFVLVFLYCASFSLFLLFSSMWLDLTYCMKPAVVRKLIEVLATWCRYRSRTQKCAYVCVWKKLGRLDAAAFFRFFFFPFPLSVWFGWVSDSKLMLSKSLVVTNWTELNNRASQSPKLTLVTLSQYLSIWHTTKFPSSGIQFSGFLLPGYFTLYIEQYPLT